MTSLRFQANHSNRKQPKKVWPHKKLAFILVVSFKNLIFAPSLLALRGEQAIIVTGETFSINEQHLRLSRSL